MKAKHFIFILLFVFSACPILAAEPFPTFPMSFYGSASLNGSPLGAGTKIQAYVDSNLVGEVFMPENGIYGYDSPTKSHLVIGEYTGDLVFKYIAVGLTDPVAGDKIIKYTAGFVSGNAVELNLNFTKAVPPAPSSGGGGGGGGGGGSSLDVTAPAQPSSFKAARNTSNIVLTWKNPTDFDFDKVILVRSDSNIDSSTVGKDLTKFKDIIYQGKNVTFTDKDINENLVYYYAIASYDKKLNYSKPVIVKLDITNVTSNGEGRHMGTVEDENGIKVLGIEYDAYKDLTSLYGVAGDIVEVVSENEANIIFGQGTTVLMDDVNKEIYEKLTSTQSLTDSQRYAIAYFIQNSTPTTLRLGAGERAGALNSFVAAFGKFPENVSDWMDAIKIGNGRWPAQKSQTAEDRATEEFKKIYLRDPNMADQHDNAAVTVISYGLRPTKRNMDSEKAAIKTFKHIYGYNPASAVDWDIIRAIAYSGAVR